MPDQIRIAVVGLDTSHAVEFTRRLQAPDCADDLRVPGARVVSCVRFETPFQDRAGLDARQQQMEEWGVTVTESLDDAVADADALMLEINDPTLHLDYIRRCAPLGKPIFLDKPLAGTTADGKEIAGLVAEHKVPFSSSSSLRFVPALTEACAALADPQHVGTYGALGRAPAGSSIIWYGVHAVEMLERVLGRGATQVTARGVNGGAVLVVEYDDQRVGVVELYEGGGYGGVLRRGGEAVPFTVDMRTAYTDQLRAVVPFLAGGPSPVPAEDAVEVMAILDAADRAHRSGKPERV